MENVLTLTLQFTLKGIFCNCRKGGLMLFFVPYRKRRIAITELPVTGIFKEEKTVGTRNLPLSIE
jgi:hypothetical protein